MFRRSVLVLAVFCVAIYYIGIAGYVEATPPNADPICKGLTGAAYGMCISAIAIGCDEDTTIPGCSEIAENFTSITGEPPTWLPSCPCGNADYFIKHLEDQLGATGCTDDVGVSLGIHTVEFVNAVGSYYPDQGPMNKQTCAIDNTSKYALTDNQAQSCIAELRLVIDAYKLTCDVP